MDLEPNQMAALLATAVGSGGVAAILSQIASAFRERRRERAIEKRIERLEKDHAECQRANANLREEVGRLREAVRRLERIEDGTQRGTRS